MGVKAQKVASIAELEEALKRSKAEPRTTLLVLDTDPLVTTKAGGNWWDVAVPEVSEREAVRTARAAYEAALARRTAG